MQIWSKARKFLNSLIEHNYLPERKFIGWCVAYRPRFWTWINFFSFSFYPCSLRSKIDSMFLSPSHSYFPFREHLRSSLGITCGLGIIFGWVRKLRRVFRLPTSNFQPPTSDFRLPTSDFRLQTSDLRLPTSVAIKSGGRPTRLLPYSKMLLVPITLFFLLLGRLCSGRFYIFYEQMWFKPPVSHWEAKWCAHYNR